MDRLRLVLGSVSFENIIRAEDMAPDSETPIGQPITAHHYRLQFCTSAERHCMCTFRLL